MCLDRPLKAIARLSMCPLFVSNNSPIANPIGVGMMKMANNAALAAVRHLIQAENAVASSERITSQEKLSAKIALAIHRFSTIQPPPSRYELNRNSNSPGTHVISESSISRTEILPMMYSKRENGRQR